MNSQTQMPVILKETCEGICQYGIQDEMFRDRELLCMGEIDSQLTNGLIMQLRYLQKTGPKKPITVFINSPGGDVTAGLALYDALTGSECPITTVCVGTAASMGAILFLAGNDREILPHSEVMLHDPSIHGRIAEKALQLQAISENLMKNREILAGIIAQRCNQSVETIQKITAKDTYFDAKEALEFGLATRIVETLGQK